jgi:hypothetical protein
VKPNGTRNFYEKNNNRIKKKFKKPKNRKEIPILRPHLKYSWQILFLTARTRKYISQDIFLYSNAVSASLYLINILDSRIAALYPTTVLQGLYRFPSPVPANKNLTNVGT